ncbi:hypothetical protein L195_g048648 [Trifolium pratense]|uniref:Uncharacterized protein n=1 Tax=Trifolium pratense TaxID=57577 RepID=A0A2K3JLX7_TRIPR|nr:hypothetical protein L195_g048648 [Trifolium pratense]
MREASRPRQCNLCVSVADASVKRRGPDARHPSSASGEDKSSAGICSRMKLSNYEASIEGYVKGPAMYVATDDLVVAPLSPISALGLPNRFKIPLNDLKENVVTIGIKEEGDDMQW